jgi:hypothetical protein
MKTPAMLKIDPSIVVSTAAAFAVLSGLGASRSLTRGVRLFVEVAWLYVTNARG